MRGKTGGNKQKKRGKVSYILGVREGEARGKVRKKGEGQENR